MFVVQLTGFLNNISIKPEIKKFSFINLYIKLKKKKKKRVYQEELFSNFQFSRRVPKNPACANLQLTEFWYCENLIFCKSRDPSTGTQICASEALGLNLFFFANQKLFPIL